MTRRNGNAKIDGAGCRVNYWDSSAAYPWFLRFSTLVWWVWLVMGSMLLGIVAGIGWWWLTVALYIAAAAVLARDPNEP
ncbi:hypothetical protein [Pseudonocardia spinosispora]|uniref:hypothetical protein n=1 Tax=Pseudonocardia spinosispora TaxID=103441 RepID=UPI0003FF0A8D|nr:hypothetical protein [Pseudonocardia spinosispora]